MQFAHAQRLRRVVEAEVAIFAQADNLAMLERAWISERFILNEARGRNRMQHDDLAQGVVGGVQLDFVVDVALLLVDALAADHHVGLGIAIAAAEEGVPLLEREDDNVRRERVLAEKLQVGQACFDAQ